jgi:anti-sigma-K factor RskA
MSADQTPEKDDDALAAEYALHLLSPAERAAFDDRLAVDGGLRARLAFWSDHFAALDEQTAPVAPPSALRAALARAVAPAAPVRKPGSLFSFGKFLWGAGLATALGLVMVTQLPEVRLPGTGPGEQTVDLPDAPAFAPGFFAELAAPENALLIAVSYSDDTGEMRLTRSVGQAPEGRVLQLWVIADGSPGPVSLGVLPATADAVVAVPEALRPGMPGATLAVSEEPPGGSPNAGPSGAVLAAAALTDA